MGKLLLFINSYKEFTSWIKIYESNKNFKWINLIINNIIRIYLNDNQDLEYEEKVIEEIIKKYTKKR